ncbi:MAG: hypothetical protein ACYDC6_13420, partial [Acidobacteriaceae bacterium]
MAQPPSSSPVDRNDPRDSVAVERKVSGILGQMTLVEEIHLIGGNGEFIPSLPHLNLPVVKMSNGPQGLRNGLGPSTAYPAGIALAATWDPSLAEREGQHLGRDARARGVNIILGP